MPTWNVPETQDCYHIGDLTTVELGTELGIHMGQSTAPCGWEGNQSVQLVVVPHLISVHRRRNVLQI